MLIEMGGILVLSTMANAVGNMISGYKGRNLQRELAEENRDFQLQRHIENANLQRELNQENHRQRLEEQENNFKLMCAKDEWALFLRDFPLNNQPSILRNGQMLSDGTVALRVLFSKSADKNFMNFIYPTVEQGLVEFADVYHNIFNSRNIIFTDKAYKDGCYGGAFNDNIKAVMKNMPVLIVDTNVLPNEICVSSTIWGFDNIDGSHETLFKLSNIKPDKDGQVTKNAFKDLADEMLAHLKFIIGCVYDTYNLFMYDRPPLLLSVSKFEHTRSNVKGDILNYPKLQAAFSTHYDKIYSMLLGDSITNGSQVQSFAEIPENFKSTILHNLRLDYAVAVKETVPTDKYLKYLDESVTAWCKMRTDMSAADFISFIKNDSSQITNYFSKEDAEYFKKLCTAYKDVETRSVIGKLCIEIENLVINAELNVVDTPKKNPSIAELSDKLSKSENIQSETDFVDL